ncbi:glycosyltransferase family 2 protein [Herbaspirillum huttiense]|uniref:glycosyltransferase family 2 protein n=1 Tax=Herbaspirillum huttiense TaxID=863372 RepID=UPI0039AFC3CD
MKISVITTTFNSAATIGDTMKSVASQTYENVEHLVIDGASKDRTLDIVREFSSSRTRVFSEPDKGIYDAMNKGFSQAEGEVIGFLNSDDLFADNDALEHVAQAFKDPEVDVCFGDLVYVTEDNLKIVRYWKSQRYIPGTFARGWAPAHPTFYVRRRALERLGNFDLNYRLAADVEFMVRYLERGQLRSAYIPRVQVRMRLGGATNQSFKNIVRQNREVLHCLRKNGISYSPLSFIIHKLLNRIWQRWAGSKL